MKFIAELLLSRMRRQKKRLAFVLLAIAASSCLVVWTIGGFQALFIDETIEKAEYLGEYDLRISIEENGAGRRGGGGNFAGPLSRETYSQAPLAQSVPNTAGQGTPPKADKKPDAPSGERPDAGAPPEVRGRGEGARPGAGDPPAGRGRGPGGRPGGRGGAGGRGQGGGISSDLIAEIRRDESVAVCDVTFPLRMFVWAPGTIKSILEDDDADETARPDVKRSLDVAEDETSPAPPGIDPENHRQALGAYRATMGTPMGMGDSFFGTTAPESRYELEDGRWFRASEKDGSAPREAVLTQKGAEKYRAKVGDPLILIGKSSLIGRTAEMQLEVVGIVDDSETDGFYISESLARELASETESELTPNTVFLKLRDGVEPFRSRWTERLSDSKPALISSTREEIAAQRAEAFRQEQSFKFQAVSGAMLAALAALLIVFTALNTNIDAQKRLIAFYRASGLTRRQVALSILIEGNLLAIPGWLAGLLAGWTIVWLSSGKTTGLNAVTVGFSFLCTAVGANIAALYPMFRSAQVEPLDALGAHGSTRPYVQERARRRRTLALFTLVGVALIAGDAALVRSVSIDAANRAALHSGLGVLALALGVAFLIPLAIRLTELIFTPIFSRLLALDGKTMERELSGNSSRVVACAIALSVGGGLFVTMQIWGYSMLDPFLPGRRSPDAFAAFLPNGLRPEIEEELRNAPFVDPDSFLPVAVEQAAFAEGSVPESARSGPFANVVFFGVDVAKAFEGETPLVGMRLRDGNYEEALESMKSGRGVIVTDSLTVDYQLGVGDTLKVVHPRDPEKTLEYPIVGVASFPGWQWLSKTGGVRRNFGRSGGLVFAREGIIAHDYQLTRRSYYWFNSPSGEPVDYRSTELACDVLARRNLRLDAVDSASEINSENQTAYVKLSTRESLTNSISRRADSVIWGLSRTPLTTLAIAAIAVVGAVANSVRARRWEYGVMRALGTTRFTLIRMILVEAAMIGIVASATSFSFGYLAAQGALKLGRSMFGTADPPLILPVAGLSTGLAMTVALCLVAALWPAVAAGRTEPLRLLRSGRTPE